MEKNKIFKPFLSFITVLYAGIALTACAFLDSIMGGSGPDFSAKYSIHVDVSYFGLRIINSNSPIYLVIFEHNAGGGPPAWSVHSDPIVSTSGKYTFTDLDDKTYGILVFIDENSNSAPDHGEVYEFYNNKSRDPDKIKLNSDQSFNISFDDNFLWVQGFFEDFNDGYADNWIDDLSGRWYVDGGYGEYVMSGYLVANYAWSYYDFEYQDFTFRVDVRQKTGVESSEKGILFRSPNPWDLNSGYFSGYLLKIDGYGKWSLERFNIGIPSTIGGGFSPNLFQGIDMMNNIEVSCTGDRITIYFNGQWNGDVYDAFYMSGRAGIFGYDDSAEPTEYHFDNVNVHR